MSLHFELSLEERTQDRVFVNVLLAPSGSDAAIDGVAVVLHAKSGERLSNRLLLPIAGSLTQPIVSTVELRALGPVPTGSVVRGTAWRGPTQWDAQCPADPGTHLEAHLRGRVAHPMRHDVELDPLECAERTRLAEEFPWLAPCEPPPPRVVEPELETATSEEIRAFCEDLDLDDEDTDWLESLLSED